MTNMPVHPVPSLATSLPYAAEFMLDILNAASEAPFGALAWPEINRLAARWLRPELRDGQTNTSQLGHAVVLEMVDRGLLEAEVTTANDGARMVERVLHLRIFGLQAGRVLAA